MNRQVANHRSHNHRTHGVFAALIVLTVITWAVGTTGLEGLSVSLSVLAIALLKGYLIGDWFMGLAQLRGPWRWAIIIWLLVPGALITTAFILTGGS